ncbi:peptide-methionine (S)-S-oxide reductase MsrA [Sphingomonas morindae]|uniref:Peptide methionine sulfoxide reductase MsrA n=1 Tax=Sphingomonas morindae TaxID=1541170 RepID=A0ABY4XDV1_9SPHN|nr:peptide-methionine (S)-S-oxide reductase MsrA [Sphingomonas morindae]USI75029.1 peptide-methionine (S)-S-oxide reductase MsrA [Sphingomonas morindae]
MKTATSPALARTALGLALGGAALLALAPLRAEPVVQAPAAALREQADAPRETAIFAGGCFWGVEGVMRHVKGVVATTAGYAGGDAATARYALVSTGTTGHAEAVRVVFDPRQVDYADLLRIYFSVITDPTQRDRQGPDEGTQYRSALFPQSAAQKRVAEAYIAQLGRAHLYPGPIVTRIEAAKGFYPAEAHHQNYLARNPDDPYIVINDQPKVAALRRLYPASWRG